MRAAPETTQRSFSWWDIFQKASALDAQVLRWSRTQPTSFPEQTPPALLDAKPSLKGFTTSRISRR